MYRVTCLYDGTTYTIHDPNLSDYRIYNDELVTEDNAPGSFKFTIAKSHPCISSIVGMRSDIRVYENGSEIWRGRPISTKEDLYGAKTITCEGELAFLYDSIQPQRELESTSIVQFFYLLMQEHNRQVTNQGQIDKTFLAGTVTVTEKNGSEYKYTNRDTTLDCLKEQIIGRLGGHLRVRVAVNGSRYLDLLGDVDTIADQPIQLGENLLDFTRDTDYTQIATACIPLGEALRDSGWDTLEEYLTIEEENDGSDAIQIDEAVQRYGYICKVLNFSDIDDPEELIEEGRKWLTDSQYENMELSLTAVDLHTLGHDVQPIRIMSQVRVISTPHGMDRYFEVKQRTYHLTQPELDTVTFGSNEKATYTSSAGKKYTKVTKSVESFHRTIDEVIAEERENISNIMNQATHGYVVMDPNTGPERILIMDTNNIDSARKIWKWDMNGLGYSNTGINGPWGTAITMNGEISANFIVTGELDASIIKTGRITDAASQNYWDLETGEFRMYDGTIWLGGHSQYFKAWSDGSVEANSVDLKGTFRSQEYAEGYWVELHPDGRLKGGLGATEYGFIDYSGRLVDKDDDSITWNGLRLVGNEMIRLETPHLSVATAVGDDMVSFASRTVTLPYITRIEKIDDDGHIQWWFNTMVFRNGILTVSGDE